VIVSASGRARILKSLLFTTVIVILSLSLVGAQTNSNVLSGKFSPENHPNFKPIPATYANGRRQYLDGRTLVAFLQMADAAKAAGFQIRIVSGTRNFNTQRAIWNNKFTGTTKVGGRNLAATIRDEQSRALAILRFSSMPGTSRHHWGTDMDLHEINMKGPALHNSSFKSGRGKDFYEWLRINAGRYGFCQPYTGDPASRNGAKFTHGYQEERWHWSYKPIAAGYLAEYKTKAEAMKPQGYAGDKVAARFYLDYVSNVDVSCQ
jgi:zinc D-Ala-D-Ala carboxypeptidase